MKKLVCGVGLYTKGKHKVTENGKITKAYHAWSAMLERCHCPNLQARYPPYIDCTACEEWLNFQSFAEWHWENYPQDGEKYQLDKDLKVIGNKIYSPETCLFVSGVVNNFTTDNGADRGRCMIGVCWDKQREKFQSNCRNPLTKKVEFLGRFTDELSAHMSWRKRKSELAYELAMMQVNPEVRDALLRWKDALDNNEIHKV